MRGNESCDEKQQFQYTKVYNDLIVGTQDYGSICDLFIRTETLPSYDNDLLCVLIANYICGTWKDKMEMGPWNISLKSAQSSCKELVITHKNLVFDHGSRETIILWDYKKDCYNGLIMRQIDYVDQEDVEEENEDETILKKLIVFI